MAGIFYFILLTHILLAGLSLPFILLAYYRGLTNSIQKHKKLVRFYVSSLVVCDHYWGFGLCIPWLHIINQMKKIVIFTFVFFIAQTAVQAQCSMCRAVVESNSDNLAEGFNNGIVYLMTFPYLALVVMVYYLFKKVMNDNKKYGLTQES